MDGDPGDVRQPLEAPVLPTVTLLSCKTGALLKPRRKPQLRPRGGGSWVEGVGEDIPGPQLGAQPNGRHHVFIGGLEAYCCF